MPFIGKEPQNHYITPTKDRFSGDASTVAFTLSRPVALPSDLEVFVDNVQQEPTSAYTINNTTLTFTGTPATGTNNIYAIHRGGGMQTLQPQDGQAGDFSTVNISSDLSVTGNITTDVTMTGTTPTLTIGDAGAEDTKIVFDGNAQDFYIALDDSADDLVIGLGSVVGTTPAIQIDENQDIKFAQSIGVGQAASSTVGEISAQTMKLLGTTPTLTIGDAGAEDSKIIFDGNAADFHVGLDDTDDKLKIGLGSALGTTPILTVADGSLLLSGTTPTLTIGDAGAEDTKIVFDGNAQDFYVGLDDSADDLVIGFGSTVGTTPAISVDQNQLTTIHADMLIGGATPTLTIGDAGAEDTKIVFDGNAQDFYIALDDSADDLLIGLGSAVGTTPAIAIDENLKVTTFGDITMTGTTPVLTIGDAGAEDAAIVFDGNAQDFYIALDDSADDLVIGKGSTIGTTPAISIDENLKTSFGGGAVGKTDTDATNTGNVTLDFDANQNFVLTFTGNVTLVNPSTESVGQTGFIAVIQDGTGSRTLTLGTDYESPASGGITLTSTANATDLIPYIVIAANRVALGTPQLAFG